MFAGGIDSRAKIFRIDFRRAHRARGHTYCRALNPADEESQMRIVCCVRATLVAALSFVAVVVGARAQDNQDVYRDVETKYIFGFTSGSGIGLEGEKEF